MEKADYAIFAHGVALFNNGEYFDCHEVWEQLWKRASGEDRSALQGLIQAAAAILHAERGNYRGAQSVYRKALRNLASAPDDCLGLRVVALRASLDAFFARLAALDASRPSSPETIASCPRLPDRPQLQLA